MHAAAQPHFLSFAKNLSCEKAAKLIQLHHDKHDSPVSYMTDDWEPSSLVEIRSASQKSDLESWASTARQDLGEQLRRR